MYLFDSPPSYSGFNTRKVLMSFEKKKKEEQYWVAKERRKEISLAIQLLRLHASNAEDLSLIPGWGTNIPHASGCGQKINK